VGLSLYSGTKFGHFNLL